MRSGLLGLVVACSGTSEEPPAAAPQPPPVTPATLLAATFSPEIVGAITPAPPTAGDYAMALDLSFDTLPTMEIRISNHRRGAWRMTLALDGTVTTCLAARRIDIADGQYHYKPADQREHRRTDVPRIVAMAGTWKVDGGVATITFDRQAWNSCDLAKATAAHAPPVAELRCIGITPPAHVSDKRLACVATDRHDLLDLGLPLTTATHVPNQSPMRSAPLGRHVIFGSPGLAVEVRQSSTAKRPSYKFQPRAVTIVEADYQPAKREPAKP